MNTVEEERIFFLASRLSAFALRIEGDRKKGFRKIPDGASCARLKNGTRIDIRGLRKDSSIFLTACLAHCLNSGDSGMTRSDMAWWKPERVSKAFKQVRDYVELKQVRVSGRMAGSRYVIKTELMSLVRRMIKHARSLSDREAFSCALTAEYRNEFVSKKELSDNALEDIEVNGGERLTDEEDINRLFILEDIAAYVGAKITERILDVMVSQRCSDYKRQCRELRNNVKDFYRDLTRVGGYEYAVQTKENAEEFLLHNHNPIFIARCCVSNDIYKTFNGGIAYQDVIDYAHVARYILVHAVELNLVFCKTYPELGFAHKNKPYYEHVKNMVRNLSDIIGRFSIDENAESTQTKNAYMVIRNRFKMTLRD